MQPTNKPESSFPKKKLYLSIVITIANLLGYSLLVWCDWRIAIGVFFLFFALNLDRRQQKEAKNNFNDFLNELVK